MHDLRVLCYKDYSKRDWSNDTSPFCLWKWCVFFYELTVVTETLIFVLYWTMLFPFKDFTNAPLDTILQAYIDHLVPFAMIVTDCLVNRLTFKRTHLWFIVIQLTLYLIDNFTVSLLMGKPVYPPIDPKTPLAYFLGCLFPITASGFFILYEKLALKRSIRYE